MNLIGFRTFLVAIVGSWLVPFAAKHGLTLTPDQQTWLVGVVMAGLMIAMRLVTKTPPGQSAAASTPAEPSSPQAGFSRIAMLIPLAVLAAGLMLTQGCATVSNALTSPSAQPYITAAVDVAVATAESKGVTAAQINSYAKQALAADQSPAATLATVSGVVNTQLAKLKLPAGDMAAIGILEIAIDAAIDAKVGKNPSVAQSQAAAADVLNAIIAVTA